jgi:hypothetical protein
MGPASSLALCTISTNCSKIKIKIYLCQAVQVFHCQASSSSPSVPSGSDNGLLQQPTSVFVAAERSILECYIHFGGSLSPALLTCLASSPSLLVGGSTSLQVAGQQQHYLLRQQVHWHLQQVQDRRSLPCRAAAASPPSNPRSATLSSSLLTAGVTTRMSAYQSQVWKRNTFLGKRSPALPGMPRPAY